MIAECMIFLASFSQPVAETGIVENYETLNKVQLCTDKIPNSMIEHVDLYVEHFDKENLYTAMRIGWCESRGRETAIRTAEGNFDSGVMQFVSWTWNWIAEMNGIAVWDSEILLYDGVPIEMHPKETYKYDLELFEFRKVQLVPYYNIKMASLLAEDTYSKVRWKDWNSSKWCWENPAKFERKWREEGY